MALNHFDSGLKLKLRGYFMHCKSQITNEFHKATLKRMSPVLRGEVAEHDNGEWVGKITFLKAAPKRERKDLITEVAMVLKTAVYIHGDKIVEQGTLNRTMYIMSKGVAIR